MMNKKGYVYLLKIPERFVYKIGVAKDVERRIKQLQTGTIEEITEVSRFLSDYPYKIEAFLHNLYGCANIKGEWFYLTDEQVDSFIKHCETCEGNYKLLDKSENPFFK